MQRQQQDNAAPSSTSYMPASPKPRPRPVGPDADPVQSHPPPIQYPYRTNDSATPGQRRVGAQPKPHPMWRQCSASIEPYQGDPGATLVHRQYQAGPEPAKVPDHVTPAPRQQDPIHVPSQQEPVVTVPVS
ncbi:hypothetical protein BDW60DRAFT_212698 [Aspergillus nidulans var. acristatus]